MRPPRNLSEAREALHRIEALAEAHAADCRNCAPCTPCRIGVGWQRAESGARALLQAAEIVEGIEL